MMKHTNMKQIGCLILFASALLVGVNGCTHVRGGDAGWIDFRVDDARYWLYWQADTDRQGRIISSSIVIAPHSEKISVGSATKFASNGKTMATKTNTLYFVQEGKIVFEKKYNELGIDTSQFNFDNVPLRDHLRPILEPLIREHLQPQEPEMEEQL